MNPQQYLTTTEAVDSAFLFIFAISGVMLLGITVAMVYFVVRYNRKRCPQPLSQKDKNLWLEIVWTIIPTALVLAMFWYGWEGYLSLQNIPDDAMEVKATARMWSWNFEYENGKSSDKLYVPVGRPVKVRLESVDVLHSFYVPAFRIKRDCVPGMTTWTWFLPEEAGSYDLFCAEYCGVGHADMITTVEALPAAEFDAWYAEKAAARPDAVALLEGYGCTGCHSLDGTAGAGPSLLGIGGSKRTVVIDGKEKEIIADSDYIRRAILEPAAEVVKGFAAIMPPYAGAIPEEDLVAIVAFLAGEDDIADGGKEGVEIGSRLVRELGCLGCHSTDGTVSVGPTFKGIYGRKSIIVRDGKELTVEADEEYLSRSIVDPAADLVVGAPPVMPTYSHLGAEDVEAIIAYLKTLK